MFVEFVWSRGDGVGVRLVEESVDRVCHAIDGRGLDKEQETGTAGKMLVAFGRDTTISLKVTGPPVVDAAKPGFLREGVGLVRN